MATTMVMKTRRFSFWFLVTTLLLVALTTVVAQEGEETVLVVDEGQKVLVQGEGGEGEVEPAYAVLMAWFVQAIGVLVFFILTRYIHALPYTAVLFILGVIMGVGSAKAGFDDQLTKSVGIWTGIDHEVLFAVFLPGLLFKDAFEINFHLFTASFFQLLILAFPMVLAGTMLTACVGLYIFPYGWSFRLALTFGSILAATDPVAVSALLNEVGAPPRLKMVISGEALLNDGSAVVFYTVFSGLFLAELDIGLGDESTVGEAFTTFFRMALGGTSVGIAYAIALVFILYKLDRRLEQEETVLQVAATVTVAYLSFYTSEIVCKMSGVIAVVVCGILAKAFGGGLISDWKVMESFWSLVEHLLNTLLFALGGIEFGNIIASEDREWQGRDWGYLIVLYICVNLIRFFLIFAFYPVISRIGIGSRWEEAVFSSWAGLRGAVGIALALGLDTEVANETDDPAIIDLSGKMFGMVGGVAFLTLLINGTLSGPLLTKLGLADSTESRKRIVKCAEDARRRRAVDDLIHLMTDPRFFFVDFALVMHHCPLLRNLTAKELAHAVEENRSHCHPSIYKSPNLEHVLPYVPDSSALKAIFEKSSRSMFMSAGATQFGTRDSFYVDETNGVEDEEEVPEESERLAEDSLVQDIRIMFIDLLRASYQAQIRDGELDPREYDGFLAYSLLQSLDFAHDAVGNGQPLEDWKYSQLVSPEFVDKFGDFAIRVVNFGCGCKKAGGDILSLRLQTLRDKEPLRYQQLRLDVLRAFSFVDAHQAAQDRLTEEFGEANGQMASAFLVVMNESKIQVRKASGALRAKNKKELKHVISHYLCIILQNKAARYVRLLLETGVLLRREGREYLEHIEENIEHIRKCDLDLHPGSLEDVKIDELLDPVLKIRKRRVKQQSIL